LPDETVGIMVTKIEKNGYLRFNNIDGSKSSNQYYGSSVIFENGTKGTIYGDLRFNQNEWQPSNKFFIDIGGDSEEITRKIVKVGDIAVYQPNTFIQNHKLFSNYLDDRIGCAILMSVIARVTNCIDDIYFVFSSQEEVGYRGIKAITQKISPDFALTIDVTAACDTPFSDFVGNTELGKGVAIKIADNTVMCNNNIINWLERVASENNILYQREIQQVGGSDTGAIQISGFGIAVGGLSIPVRYVHNPIEVANIADIDACTELLVKSLNRNECY